MNLVPLGEAHLPGLARRLNDLPGMRGWDVGWVRRKTLASQDYNPALTLAAEVQGELVGFVVAAVHENRGWIKALLVRPDRQRQGVGSHLLRAIEDRLAQLGVPQVTFGWAPLNYFTPGVDVRLTAANAFLERRGYSSDRVSRINMEVQLEGQDFDTVQMERRLSAEGITIRRAEPADAEGTRQLAEGHGFVTWRDECDHASQNDPISMFVARRDGRVCGFAVHSITGPGEFGPMLTALTLRGRGIGTILLKRCLADLKRLSYRHAEIIWAGPISFYARAVGARVGRAFWEWKKALEQPGEVIMPEHSGN